MSKRIRVAPKHAVIFFGDLDYRINALVAIGLKLPTDSNLQHIFWLLERALA